MATVASNIITIRQKEAMTLPINITDSAGKTYIPAASDSVVFTVKESLDITNIIIQKPVTDGQVTLTANDTSIATGFYMYDVQLTASDGFVSTLIKPTQFVVTDKISMQRDIDITKFLPPVTKDIRDVQKLCEAENIEFRLMWNYLLEMFNNQFIATMTEYGLEQWEKIFDVIPLSTDVWDDRRARIQSLIKGTRPYTDEKLEELLDLICGKGGYAIDRDYANYKITIKVNLGVKSKLLEGQQLLETIIPMNLGLTVTLNYNRHKDLKKLFTHGEMKSYKHKSLREDVLP